MKTFNSFFVPMFGALVFFASCGRSDYKDPATPVEERVQDLLSEMTLEEKVAQTLFYRKPDLLWDSSGNFNTGQAKSDLINGMGMIGVGHRNADPGKYAKAANDIQKFMMEETRLGIPAFIYGEGLHGFMAKGATVFPQALALGSTWDTSLVRRVFDIAGREMRVRGANQALTPVLGLGREPRWGRIEETYGEDPFLGAQMGKSAILGFQGGKEIRDRDHVAATAKHYAVHSQPEGGVNIAPGNISRRIIRENFLFPFEAAVREAGVRCIMSAYNEIDGIPCSIDTWLLTDVLRNEWGFGGYVISDLGSLEELVNVHAVAADPSVGAKLALEAGVDLELFKRDGCFPTLAELVREGVVPEKLLDQAVARVLKVKLEIGLFEKPYADTEKMKEITNCPEHREVALKAAEEALVLLKNENGMLPLDEERINTLAVIGPNAKGVHFGGYSAEPRVGTDVLDGIREYAGGKFNVEYAEGCKIQVNEASFWNNENPVPNDPGDDAELIAQATEVARRADVVLLVIGGTESTCREAWGEDHLGDRDNLKLPGRQGDLVKAVWKTGKPVVALLINGRPLSTVYLADHVPAILEGWYLGQETGTAVARVLFGEVNPSGKLSVTILRSVGQLPAYYNKKPSRFRSYLFTESGPLYPFGHGLGYTEYKYSDLALSNASIPPDGQMEVTCSITNTGKKTGEEVVQLYIRDQVSSVTRPVKELKGFKKIGLDPGETRQVSFQITPDLLQFYNKDMERVVEPGKFTLMIGSSSEDIRLETGFEVTE